MHFTRSFVVPLAAALAGIVLWTGCESSLFSGMEDDRGGSGVFNVLLTDAPFPFDLVDEANVTIAEVQLVPAAASEGEEETTDGDGEQDTGIITLKSQWEVEGEQQDSVSFNLLELRNGVTTDLVGDAEIPSGTYSQVRLLVAGEASLVDTTGTEYNLKVPSGTETGVKVQLDSLEVEAGTETTLTLDFDLEDSFVLRGSLNGPGDINGIIFKPVVHLKSVADGAPEESDTES